MAIEEWEEKQAEGYCRHPVKSGEFDIWESEPTWGYCMERGEGR
jgi:hypothetical protein